jgi:hypothetical protein
MLDKIKDVVEDVVDGVVEKVNPIKDFMVGQVKMNYKVYIDTKALIKEQGIEGLSSMRDIGETTINGKKVYLKHFNGIFVMQGQKDLPSALVCKINGEFMILVNDAFMAASKEERDAILAHELGHIKCGHLDNPNPLNMFKRMLGMDSTIQMELEADKVAIEAGHMDGLSLVMDKIEEFYDMIGMGRKEIMERKRQLRVAVWKEVFGTKKTKSETNPALQAALDSRGGICPEGHSALLAK